jgi:hypothetical protein
MTVLFVAAALAQFFFAYQTGFWPAILIGLTFLGLAWAYRRGS